MATGNKKTHTQKKKTATGNSTVTKNTSPSQVTT